MEWDGSKCKILNKVGLLCLALNKDYRRETLWRIGRIEETQGITLDTKFKRREIENNLEIGAFVIDSFPMPLLILLQVKFIKQKV